LSKQYALDVTSIWISKENSVESHLAVNSINYSCARWIGNLSGRNYKWEHLTCNINEYIQETCLGKEGIPLSGNPTTLNSAHCTGYRGGSVGVSRRMFDQDKVNESML
jgi:hypothetical protein